MTKEALLEVFLDSKLAVYHLEELVHDVLEGARQIFGILILVRRPECISNFIRNDRFQYQLSHLDHKTPFQYEILGKILPKDIATDFYETQWEFTAPVFTRRVLPRFLEEDTVMPFLKDTIVGEGGFGVIHEIEIHPFHEKFGITDVQTVCRTTLELPKIKLNMSVVCEKRVFHSQIGHRRLQD